MPSSSSNGSRSNSADSTVPRGGTFSFDNLAETATEAARLYHVYSEFRKSSLYTKAKDRALNNLVSFVQEFRSHHGGKVDSDLRRRVVLLLQTDNHTVRDTQNVLDRMFGDFIPSRLRTSSQRSDSPSPSRGREGKPSPRFNVPDDPDDSDDSGGSDASGGSDGSEGSEEPSRGRRRSRSTSPGGFKPTHTRSATRHDTARDKFVPTRESEQEAPPTSTTQAQSEPPPQSQSEPRNQSRMPSGAFPGTENEYSDIFDTIPATQKTGGTSWSDIFSDIGKKFGLWGNKGGSDGARDHNTGDTNSTTDGLPTPPPAAGGTTAQGGTAAGTAPATSTTTPAQNATTGTTTPMFTPAATATNTTTNTTTTNTDAAPSSFFDSFLSFIRLNNGANTSAQPTFGMPAAHSFSTVRKKLNRENTKGTFFEVLEKQAKAAGLEDPESLLGQQIEAGKRSLAQSFNPMSIYGPGSQMPFRPNPVFPGATSWNSGRNPYIRSISRPTASQISGGIFGQGAPVRFM